MSTWVSGRYVIATEKGDESVHGIVNNHYTLGVHFNGSSSCDVTHIMSGKRIYSFRHLGEAVAFADKIESLANWKLPHPEMPNPDKFFELMDEAVR
jgi:hypothetical protein